MAVGVGCEGAAVSEVVEASEDDLRAAVKAALDRLGGITFEQLEHRIRSSNYDARDFRAWVAIGGLGHLAPDAKERPATNSI